jgi:flagellar basal-body rod protein FlgB
MMMMRLAGVNIDTSISPLGNALSGLSKMQQATADNIANVNTPGYKAKRPELSNVLGLSDNPYETSLAQRMGSSQLSSLLQTPDNADGKVNVQQEFLAMQKNLLLFNLVSKRLTTIITNLKASGNVGR